MNGRVHEAVGRFFEHLSARDWAALRDTLAPGVARIGPFGDRIVGADAYVEFLEASVPADYGNDVHLIVEATDGTAGFARVTEHLGYPDQELSLEEAYAFGFDEDGLVEKIEVFWQTPQLDPGGFGSAS